MLSGARVFVTGASGFLGANLVRRVLSTGAKVTVLMRPGVEPWRLDNVRDRVQIVEGDLTSLGSENVLAGLGGVDVVYHFAATGLNQTVADDLAMIQTNVAGTYLALDFARRAGAARFIHLGTSGEYGPCQRADEEDLPRPTGIYGATKASATILARAFSQRYGLDVVVLRPFAVYGPYESSFRLVPHCILRSLHGVPIEISSGEQTRDYIHVDDVVQAAELVASHPQAPGHTFNLCWGADTPIKDVVTRVVALTGSQSPILFGAKPHIPGEMWKTSGNPSKASALLGWAPRVKLDDGLRATIDWFRKHAAAYDEYRS
jgi:nucleoside-diphosphate-sugar epimerase